MVIAAFVVSIVSALGVVGAVWYARRSDRSAAKSAAAAAATAALDLHRRHAELTPCFRVTCQASNPGSKTLRLGVFLAGPPDLERLDALTVTIRDDHPWRGQGTPLAGGPTPEQVAKQIWGPYQFIPGTGPGADSTRGIPGADPTGRTTPTGGMPVGEELPFFLDRTRPPSWSQQPQEFWQQERGNVLRLRLECHREGWDPWTLTCEIATAGDLNTVEVPSPSVLSAAPDTEHAVLRENDRRRKALHAECRVNIKLYDEQPQGLWSFQTDMLLECSAHTEAFSPELLERIIRIRTANQQLEAALGRLHEPGGKRELEDKDLKLRRQVIGELMEIERQLRD